MAGWLLGGNQNCSKKSLGVSTFGLQQLDDSLVRLVPQTAHYHQNRLQTEVRPKFRRHLSGRILSTSTPSVADPGDGAVGKIALPRRLIRQD